LLLLADLLPFSRQAEWASKSHLKEHNNRVSSKGNGNKMRESQQRAVAQVFRLGSARRRDPFKRKVFSYFLQRVVPSALAVGLANWQLSPTSERSERSAHFFWVVSIKTLNRKERFTFSHGAARHGTDRPGRKSQNKTVR